jgi:hypothetical protein
VWPRGDAFGEIPQNGDAEITLVTRDGGSEWRGFIAGEGMA